MGPVFPGLPWPCTPCLDVRSGKATGTEMAPTLAPLPNEASCRRRVPVISILEHAAICGMLPAIVAADSFQRGCSQNFVTGR